MVDSYENQYKAYLVLERAGTTTLYNHYKDVLKDHIDFNEVKDIAKQILTAVDFLHDNRIVHRDIKPDNVMLAVAPSLQVKLIDFNIAHDLAHEPEIRGTNGVREWSAPETRKFIPYDEKCDLYSVGCILYFMCTGSPPSLSDVFRRADILQEHAGHAFGLGDAKRIESFVDLTI